MLVLFCFVFFLNKTTTDSKICSFDDFFFPNAILKNCFKYVYNVTPYEAMNLDDVLKLRAQILDKKKEKSFHFFLILLLNVFFFLQLLLPSLLSLFGSRLRKFWC